VELDHVIIYYALIAVTVPLLFLLRKEWTKNKLGPQPMHVKAKLTIFSRLSLQENNLLALQFFLRHAVWEKQCDRQTHGVWLLYRL
jgi:hypothetical protein